MGWLPIFPHHIDTVKCHMCEKLLRDPHTSNLPYYIVWTPDPDDPEEEPTNIYFICEEDIKEAMKVNNCCIKRPPVKYETERKSFFSFFKSLYK